MFVWGGVLGRDTGADGSVPHRKSPLGAVLIGIMMVALGVAMLTGVI